MLYKSPRLRFISLLALFSLLPLSSIYAQEEIGEEALFRFEEYVVSASKRIQRIEEAPATITVITAEDIKQSGLTSIPEILRQVAGLDVATLTTFDTQVAIRGYCGRAVSTNVLNKILVLINGRSVYEDLFGGTIWEALPIQLEDIERIEIVKGPGSVLYGANALTGVINIITKSPDESPGGFISASGGQFNHYIGSLGYAGKARDFGYRLSGGWEGASRLDDRDEDAEKIGRFLGIFNYKISDSSEVTLEGGISDGEGEVFINLPGAVTDIQKVHVKANYNYSDFKAQVFWNGGSFDMPLPALLATSGTIREDILPGEQSGSLEGEIIRGKGYTYDVELQQSINLAEIHTILGGLNYRFFTMRCNYTEQKGLHTYAGFLQYEIKPIPSTILNLGVRVDYQEYIGTNYSPRGSLIITPAKGHTLFTSVGHAFRNPAYIDLFADASLELYVEGSLLGEVEAKGREDVKPESITSYEAGYRAALFGKLRANLEVFYNVIKDVIHTFGDIPEELVTPPFTVRSNNYLGNTEIIGGEAGLEYQVTPWLTGFINYSYEEVYEDLVDEPRVRLLSSPKNKVNLGLRAALKNGFSANVLIHYVDASKKEYALPDIIPPTWDLESVDPYILLNARVSYKFLNDRLEVAASGQNLLNVDHKEIAGAAEIPLRVFGSLSVKF